MKKRWLTTGDWLKKEWFIVTVIALLVLNLITLFFVIMLHKNYSFDHLRNLTTTLTVAIGGISLICTVYFTNRTANFNRENQNSNFLMGLMVNHYKLLENERDQIDKIMEHLEAKFVKKEYILDRAVKQFKVYLRNHNSNFRNEVSKISVNDREGIKQLNKIFRENNVDAIARLLISYYHEKDKRLYSFFSSTVTGKLYDKPSIQSIVRDTGLFNLIDDFVAANTDVINAKLEYDDICKICNEIFDDSYSKIGHFFRNSYRIIKSINEIYKYDDYNRNSYRGILRSQYSEGAILAIYYNCVFTDKGIGYARELIGSDFFGDKDDLKIDDPIHFRKGKLIFKDDLKLMKKIFVSEEKEIGYEIDPKILKGKIKSAFNHT